MKDSSDDSPEQLTDSIDDSPDQLIESRDILDGKYNEVEGILEEAEDIEEESISKNQCESFKDDAKLNDDSDDDQGESIYPDTSIQLQYVSGER